MPKTVISILTTIILTITLIKLGIFNKQEEKSCPKIVTQATAIQNINPIETPNIEIKPSTQKSLKEEIKLLFEKANRVTNKENYPKALNIYNIIIKKLNKSQDIESLKKFAKAHSFRAYIFKNYLQQNDEAIKAYDQVAKRLKKSDNIELLKLYYKAQKFKTYLLSRDESIDVYDEIIQKFKNSADIELLKIFSSAQFAKSYLLIGNKRLDVYDEIIDKLIGCDNIELLGELATAQFSKAHLLSDYFQDTQEAIEVYDEIIEKFNTYTDGASKQNVDDALFSKSFILMSENGEESMEILDELINRYKCSASDSKIVSKNLEYSIINNIELALITNNSDGEYRELAEEYLSDLKDTKPQLEMLEILKNAQIENQDSAVQRWIEEYKEYHFENWSFEELKSWNNKMDNGEQKDRIKECLDKFIKHNNS